MTEPRILITGVTGMVGSHLAEFLVKELPKAKIFGVRRSWRSKSDNLALVKDKIEIRECDLSDQMSTLRLLDEARPDYVFHLAALSYVHDSWKMPQLTTFVNAGMQVALFEAIRYLKLDPVIQIALSSECYGLVHPDELPITELTPFRPLSPYAVSKITQDMLGYQYHQSYGMKVVRTRAFNHEGPRRGEVFVTSNFAKQIAEIEAGLQGPQIHVGNLDAQRDWSDVRDIVRAYWLAVNRCKPGEDYVIASGISRTVREMLDLLLSLTDAKVEVVQDPARVRPSDVQLLQGDPSKFVKATGWKAEYTFEQTMRDLLNYWREQVGVKQPVSRT